MKRIMNDRWSLTRISFGLSDGVTGDGLRRVELHSDIFRVEEVVIV